jgi:hypothetical protein
MSHRAHVPYRDARAHFRILCATMHTLGCLNFLPRGTPSIFDGVFCVNGPLLPGGVL